MKTIFVSSTFKDMHFERDAIQDITLPIINKEAAKYGQKVSFCDLRWGVNTTDLDSDQGSRKVLDVCLDEIDRCNPPMVVILGDRYGWIPDETLVQTAAMRKQFRLESYQASVTALEVEYGALADQQKQYNTLFYFREIVSDAPEEYLPEDDAHQQKLRELKAKILEKTNGKIKTYQVRWNGQRFDGVREFAEMLASDLQARLTPEWEIYAKKSPFERELLTHWTYIEEKSSMFRAGKTTADALLRDICGETYLHIIKGAVGSGKSTMFSHLAKTLRDAGKNVLPVLSGLTSASNDAFDILKLIVYYLENDLQLNHFSEDQNTFSDFATQHSVEDWRKRADELCGMYADSGKELIIMLDAADQLFADENRARLVFIPRCLSSNIRFVMTCTSDFDTHGFPFYELRPLDKAEKKEVILGTLQSLGRELDNAVIDEMLLMKASDNPLFLSLLIQRLTMMNHLDFSAINAETGDQMNAISRHQIEVIRSCPQELEKMSAALLEEAGRRINTKLVNDAARYIAVSRHGLRVEDLAALLKNDWDTIDFAHFVAYMSDSFIKRDDGRYDFSHKSIRAGFQTLCKKPTDIHTVLLSYLFTLPPSDDLRKSEFVYHCIQADAKFLYINFITENMYSDMDAIREAAKTTYEFCLVDKGKWLCELFDQTDKTEYSSYFIDFINEPLAGMFGASMEEIHIFINIVQSATALAVRMENQEPSSLHRLLISCCNSSMAARYYQLGGQSNLMRALELSLDSLEQFKRNHEERHIFDSALLLSRGYEKAGDIYRALSGVDHIRKSLDMLYAALSVLDEWKDDPQFAENERAYNQIYWSIASDYEMLGGEENLQKELAINYQILNYHKGLLTPDAKPIEIRDCSVTYHKTAKNLILLGGTANIQKAIGLLEQALLLNQEIYTDLPAAVTQSDRALFLSMIAENYLQLGSSDDIQKALYYYKQCIQTHESLAGTLKTPDAYHNLANAYHRCADIYRRFHTQDAYNKGIQSSIKAIGILTDLLQNDGTATVKRDLSSAYEILGLIYIARQSGEDCQLAFDAHKNALSLRLALFEELRTTEAKKYAGLSYGNLCVCCTSFPTDDKEHIEAGIRYGKKAVEIAREVYDEEKTLDAQRCLGSTLVQLGIACSMAESEAEHLQAAGYLQEGAEILEALIREQPSEEFVSTLCTAYALLSNTILYAETPQQGAIDRALEINEKAIHLLKQINTSNRIFNTQFSLLQNYSGLINCITQQENPNGDAGMLAFVAEALEFADSLENQESEDTFALQFAKASLYSVAASYYTIISIEQYCEKAEQLYLRTLDILGHILLQNSSDTVYRLKAEISSELALLYETVDPVSFSDLIKKYYEDAVHDQQLVAEDNGSDEDLSDLSDIYCNYASFFLSDEQLNDYPAAISLYQRAIQILNQLYKKTGDPGYYNRAMQLMIVVADIYSRLNTTAYTKLALETCQEAIRMIEELLGLTGQAPEVLQGLADCLSLQADIYENSAPRIFFLKGKQKQALALRLQAVDIYRKLADEIGSDDIYEGYLLCLMGIISSDVIDDDDCEKYAEEAYALAKEQYPRTGKDIYAEIIRELEAAWNG